MLFLSGFSSIVLGSYSSYCYKDLKDFTDSYMSYLIASLIGVCIISVATIRALDIKTSEFFGHKAFSSDHESVRRPIL